jgi:hypothetical protein
MVEKSQVVFVKVSAREVQNILKQQPGEKTNDIKAD